MRSGATRAIKSACDTGLFAYLSHSVTTQTLYFSNSRLRVGFKIFTLTRVDFASRAVVGEGYNHTSQNNTLQTSGYFSG